VTAADLAHPRAHARRGAIALDRIGADALAGLVLSGCFALIAALTWRKWGVPEIDAGAELSTAGLIAHGSAAYQDVRYFYGPLGLYSLALAFKLLGTSFTVAYAFGLAQAAAILAAFYALSRAWLRPLAAGLSTGMLLAIGFSGTAFNFVLPHTNSATIGMLCLLLALLALTRRRLVLAGVCLGLVGLTRPEYVAIGAAVGLAYLVGTLRDAGLRPALAAAWRLALPGLAIPVAVLGALYAQVGSTLITENLWPVDFLRIAGLKTQEDWMPFTAASVVGLGLRAAVYGGLLAAVVLAAVQWRRRTGAGRLVALWPLAAALLALAVGDGVLRGLGIAEVQRSAVEDETKHLILGMSWLPALSLAVAAVAGVRFLRRRSPLLSSSWALDLALLVAAAGLGLRAYNAFTAEGSYAPYYAAPLVLVLGILHERVGDRWPAARTASMAALAAAAVGLATYALAALYADDTTAVHSSRGTFVTTAAAAPALQRTIDAVASRTRAGQAILAAPADGGLYFMTDRRPALHELMLLPGLLDSPADQRAAVAALERQRVPLAVIGARDFSAWGWQTWGRDYNALLGGWLRQHASGREAVGTFADPEAGTYPSKGFELLTLAH
jgi:hypothetical protein